MKTLHLILIAAAVIAVPAVASAQTCPGGAQYDTSRGGCAFQVYDQARGELSPHTQAPSADSLEAMLRGTSAPGQIAAMLEYGERVECTACVPLLERRLIEDSDPTVRELAAWWLRRRPFGFGAVMHEISQVLATDADPVHRERAAAAIGEFMEPAGVTHLGNALMTDTSPAVRAAAVRGIARINSASGLPFISMALADTDPTVQEAALSVILRVNFFSDAASVMPLLTSSQANLRRRSANVLGALRFTDAAPVLAEMLATDTDRSVRQAAAWALGQLHTAEARAALTTAVSAEHDSLVLDAVQSALHR